MVKRPQDFEDHKKGKDEDKETVRVQVMSNGPLVVKGKIKAIDTDGEVLKTSEFTSFCRCGHSNDMPYCDGMHRKA